MDRCGLVNFFGGPLPISDVKISYVLATLCCRKTKTRKRPQNLSKPLTLVVERNRLWLSTDRQCGFSHYRELFCNGCEQLVTQTLQTVAHLVIHG